MSSVWVNALSYFSWLHTVQFLKESRGMGEENDEDETLKKTLSEAVEVWNCSFTSQYQKFILSWGQNKLTFIFPFASNFLSIL